MFIHLFRYFSLISFKEPFRSTCAWHGCLKKPPIMIALFRFD